MPRIPVPAHLRQRPFARREGLDSGLGEKRLRGRDLAKPFHGARATDAPSTIAELAAAFQARASDNTFFCSTTAALIMGVPLPWRHESSALLHVGVRAPLRAVRAQGAIGHKLRIDDVDLREWGGLRITSPARTWCDLAPLLQLGDLVAAGDYLIHWELPLTHRGGLFAAMDRHPGRRGRANLLAAIDLLDERSESRQESRLRVLVTTAGVPGVVANMPIRTSGGYDYRADLAIPDKKVIIEYQSRFHDGAKEFRADMTRISRLEADGWYVIQVNKDDLDTPEELLQRISLVLSRR
jgi:very-short-patch-repair endonuclease